MFYIDNYDRNNKVSVMDTTDGVSVVTNPTDLWKTARGMKEHIYGMAIGEVSYLVVTDGLSPNILKANVVKLGSLIRNLRISGTGIPGRDNKLELLACYLLQLELNTTIHVRLYNGVGFDCVKVKYSSSDCWKITPIRDGEYIKEEQYFTSYNTAILFGEYYGFALLRSESTGKKVGDLLTVKVKEN